MTTIDIERQKYLFETLEKVMDSVAELPVEFQSFTKEDIGYLLERIEDEKRLHGVYAQKLDRIEAMLKPEARFLLILDTDSATYLAYKSKFNHKAEIVRQAIRAAADTDVEYQQFKKTLVK